MSRVVVVTGGGSGIGQAICRSFAKHGDSVAVVDVNEESVSRMEKELIADGTRAIGCPADVSDRAQVDAAMEKARSEFGPVQVLVTSAAIAPRVPYADITLEQWNRVLAVNLTGTFNCVQSALPDMISAGWGRVVLISSSSAQRGGPGMAHYAASKGGIIAFSKTVALEHAATGVTVNNIAPSMIDTPSMQAKRDSGMFPAAEVQARTVPVQRLGKGDDIAAACLFLCSEEASFVTGQTLSVNGGAFVGW